MKPYLHVVGARPQFVKAAVVLAATADRPRHQLLHTGQHYDAALSQVFFDELEMAPPDHHLEIGSGRHGAQTGAMLAAIEAVVERTQPAAMVVYGDTNSTLAGALAAAKLHVPVVHVEAGLRSFDRRMPEEINRVATDHVSDVLLCPTHRAVDQLASEGLAAGEGARRVLFTGDVMLDLALQVGRSVQSRTAVGRWLADPQGSPPAPLDALPVDAARPGGFAVATLHRAANTDDPARLGGLLAALGDLPWPVLLPLHPRTRHAMARAGLKPTGRLCLAEPAGYLDFTALLHGCARVFTDSGGVQKEALFAGRPCDPRRHPTVGPAAGGGGGPVGGGPPPTALRAAAQAAPEGPAPLDAFGDGDAGGAVARAVESLG